MTANSPTAPTSTRLSMPVVFGLFAVSGFAALAYQVVWQRALFAIYGVNIESVTIVVTAFMLGLGMGSFAGGRLSRDPGRSVLLWFGGIELAIGVYGAASLWILRGVGVVTAGAGPIATFGLSFALVLLPTALMGATLPLLVAHLVNRSGNVGKSVGALYFVNTLGSAGAAIATAVWVMGSFGQQGTVWLAAAANFLVGGTVLYLRRGESAAGVEVPPTSQTSETKGQSRTDAKKGTFATAMVVAALAGFLSLSYEVIWFRVYAFVTAGSAPSFGVVLGIFLLGVALGSLGARQLCKDDSTTGQRTQLAIPAALLWAGSLGGFILIPIVAWCCTSGKWTTSLYAVAMVAGLLGAILPLVAHFGIPADERAGERLSWLYLANIVGSASGSLVTGFVLLDTWPLATVSVALTVVGALISAVLFVAAGAPKVRILGVFAAIALAGGAIAGEAGAFTNLWEKLQFKTEFSDTTRFTHVVENRSGVITVDKKGKIYGGGVYDGAFNTNPLHDTNMVVRPYALSGFHPRMQRVLMIGLSSGSWAQIVAHQPDVKELVIIEINPGYNQLVAQFPQVSSLLRNPKVRVVIDDGRRWMLANPGEKFDAIVMNTTFHWRGSATNLLSTEFMHITKSHLRDGGIVFYNTTENLNAMKTGCDAFEHGVRIINFMLLSDRDLTPDKARWRKVLEGYQLDGKPVFDLGNKWHKERVDEMVELRDSTLGVTDGRWFETCKSIKKYTKHHPIITDDNMVTEFYRPWDAVPQ